MRGNTVSARTQDGVKDDGARSGEPIFSAVTGATALRRPARRAANRQIELARGAGTIP